MTKIIGLTGGIGSGKTQIAAYLKSLDIPVYFSDDEAKKIMQTPEVIDLIRKRFGAEVINTTTINREKLASLVFNNPKKLESLNSIIHPRVKNNFDIWVRKHTNFPFVIKETAILFESGSSDNCDYIISVTAPLETRISRVLDRDQTDRLSVIERINNQWTDEQRNEKSDFIIENIDFENTKLQIDEIVKILNNS